MEYHLDYGLRLKTDTQYKNLYTWAINEVGTDGGVIGCDQIPWHWTLCFSAKSCLRTDRFEITPHFSLTSQDSEEKGPPSIETEQQIQLILKPGLWAANGQFIDDVSYSMFGTARAIQHFVLSIRPLKNASEKESCGAWGSVSFTTEVDFRPDTTEDSLWFFLAVKQETFSRYVALIDQGAIDNITFSVGMVDGFYSEWSPSISTDTIKVLLNGDEQEVTSSSDLQIKVPRLGRIKKAQLLFRRGLEFS